jgi:hypothetical protein
MTRHRLLASPLVPTATTTPITHDVPTEGGVRSHDEPATARPG